MKKKQEPAPRSASPPVREFDQPIPCDSCSSNVPSQQRRKRRNSSLKLNSRKRRNSRLKLNAMDDTYSKGHEENTKVRRSVWEQEQEMMKNVERNQSKSREENTKFGKQRSWEHEEEMTLLKFARTLSENLPYQEHKAVFHTQLAEMMNKHYGNKKHFDARKIRGKLEIYEKHWYGQVGFDGKTMCCELKTALWQWRTVRPAGTFFNLFIDLN